MKVKDIHIFKEDRFTISIDVDSATYCISFPVFNGMVEYSEYYKISDEEYKLFSTEHSEAKKFVDECRNQNRDSRLMQKPGKLRGQPV